MVKYKCGCISNGVIILDDSILSMNAYLDWVNSVGLNGDRTKCWSCYCKESEKN